jgi:hypothetical protein
MPRTAVIRFRQELLAPHDPSHGTPHEMIRRTIEFDLPDGVAQWEQTDYGHPGRLNPWDPRRIDAKLQPKTAQLRAAADAIGALLA